MVVIFCAPITSYTGPNFIGRDASPFHDVFFRKSMSLDETFRGSTLTVGHFLSSTVVPSERAARSTSAKTGVARPSRRLEIVPPVVSFSFCLSFALVLLLPPAKRAKRPVTPPTALMVLGA